MYIFSMENPFFRFVGKVVDLVWLNLLTLVCCIPIFTVGASLCAMYRVLIKMAMNEEGTITGVFFREFKNSFKSSIRVWLPSALIFVFLGINARLLTEGALSLYGSLYIPVGVSIGLLMSAILIFWQYCFAIMARYDLETGKNVKNSLLLMLGYLPSSLSILLIILFPVALMLISDYFLWFWFLYGFSIPGYFIAMVLGRIFRKSENYNEPAEI